MPYRLLDNETPEKALRRIARNQVNKALRDIHDSDLDRHETVHEVRKRCKKIRGLIRLMRPAFDGYKSENTWFRDVARKLSDIRDAAALIECVDSLTRHYAADLEDEVLGTLRSSFVERRDAIYRSIDIDERLKAFTKAIKASQQRIDTWVLTEDSFEAVRGGLEKTYKRGRKAMRKAFTQPEVERFHEWRKRVKYHRYHIRLLRRLWPVVMQSWRDEVKRLSNLLGDDHDLGVLRGVIVAEEERFGSLHKLQVYLALIDQRRTELQAAAHTLGRRVYADKPAVYTDRIGRYWTAWRAECHMNTALNASLP